MSAPTGLGALLKLYREDAGLSQEALAERAGLSARSVSDLERGISRNPRHDTLALLAGALSLSVQQRDLLRAVARSQPGPETAGGPGRDARSIPEAATPLIGREHERAQAFGLLRRPHMRLLTLVGPSGVGKTRLALELAHDLAADFAEGAAFIELAAIREAGLVPGAVAQALGLRERKDTSPEEQLAGFLRHKHFLLVLDNVEQVPGCAPFLSALLANCPRLVVLLTSRTPLRLRGEQALPLAPLPLETAAHLFAERAKAVSPWQSFPRHEVEAICRRLDCLPLAIELAAMQVRVLSLAELHERLANRLALRRGGARDLPARQQTMEDAVAWSYELLSVEEQCHFRALGVFAGGWTLAAAGTVWGLDGLGGEERAILSLSVLVDASLVQSASVSSGPTHFGLLQVIQEYALQQLRGAGEEEQVRRRHAGYYAGLAETAFRLNEQDQTLTDGQAAMAQELSNARAALAWAEEQRETALGLRLSGFARLWHIRGQLREAEHWLVRMLELDRQARERAESAAPLTVRVERLYALGRVLLGFGQPERARAAAAEALQLAEQIGDEDGISNAFATLGLIAQAEGQLAEAARAFTECYAHARQTRQTGLTCLALINLAELARAQGNAERAAVLFEEALGSARSAGLTWTIANITTLLGHTARQQQDYPAAKSRYRESLSLYRAFASPKYTAWCLEGYAAALSAEGKHAQVARLSAAAVALREQAQTPLPTAEREPFEQTVARAKAALAAKRFHTEWLAGSAMGIDEAIDYALSAECV